MSSDADVYQAIRRALGEVDVSWYLFGGQAAILHGATRFTEDIDITVKLAGQSTTVLAETLRRHGFEMRVDNAKFVEHSRVLPALHIAGGTPVDFVVAGPGLEDMFFDRIVTIDIEGEHVPVACAADIVVMKILSGRAKDLADVEAILGAQGAEFEEQRVRDLLTMLEEALGQSDLLLSFQACLDSAKHA